MHAAYDRMHAAFYDRMQPACVPSVAPALYVPVHTLRRYHLYALYTINVCIIW